MLDLILALLPRTQHPGSETRTWKDKNIRDKMKQVLDDAESPSFCEPSLEICSRSAPGSVGDCLSRCSNASRPVGAVQDARGLSRLQGPVFPSWSGITI
jgi:hypothetical protein